jgi:hypothetical protein
MYTGGGPCTLCAADGPGGDWVVVFTLTYYAYYANQRTPDSRGGRQLTRREFLCAPRSLEVLCVNVARNVRHAYAERIPVSTV